MRAYMGKVTGMSRAQLTGLIRRHRETGRVEDRRGKAPAKPFERRCRSTDIELLAQVAAALGQMSGPATCALMRRQYAVFRDRRFERLATRGAETPGGGTILLMGKYNAMPLLKDTIEHTDEIVRVSYCFFQGRPLELKILKP